MQKIALLAYPPPEKKGSKQKKKHGKTSEESKVDKSVIENIESLEIKS